MTRYAINYGATSDNSATFELRIDNDNIPFHLSFRPGQGAIILNAMENGVWGSEVAFSCPLQRLGSRLRPKVDVGENTATFHFGEVQWALGSLQGVGPDLEVVVEGLTYTVEVLPEEALPEAGSDVALLSFVLAGRQLLTGDAVNLEAASQVAGRLHDGPLELIHFMGSRHFPRDLDIFDASRDSGLAALHQALLNPLSAVTHVGVTPEASDFVRGIASRNAIDNLTVLDPGEGRAWLASRRGAVSLLIQGHDIIGAYGDVLAARSDEERLLTHVFSEEESPVPGDVVFRLFGSGATNVRVRSGQWALSHLVTPGARRPGLDVVVAAYNVRDYVVDCVASLLSDGRDDIRVIVVNDGSTDDTAEVVSTAFAGETRVLLATKANGGCASARNYGRLLSTASHVTFVDADDFVTPNFFADLYDLSLYTGREITQGGFDFYDANLAEPYYASYEEDSFRNVPRTQFRDQGVIQLYSSDLIKGQPSIWRKVYRRDFLDAKNIWFPENVRAYDDYIFHILSLTAARDIMMMPAHLYHYRQHPAQDIKAGDERHFYMLHMFQMLLRRSVDEGWSDFSPYAQSVVDCIDWSAGKLAPQLVDAFLEASARFCVAVRKVYGERVMPSSLLKVVRHPDFLHHFRREEDQVAHVPAGVHWAFIAGVIQHPDLLRMRRNLPAAD